MRIHASALSTQHLAFVSSRQLLASDADDPVPVAVERAATDASDAGDLTVVQLGRGGETHNDRVGSIEASADRGDDGGCFEVAFHRASVLTIIGFRHPWQWDGSAVALA